ncbi:cytochrome c oxidase-assembly factor COX23 [Microsporum canis CBS 113480]|uniref:Cytochrome c oxidase-assembly factor COX23 n=1 Tax=Arthroderma otae (strain ATCC MYA-4605 / CBS 113480) TaxID=554155 RepID=C5FXY0_ARTOC|nr:cytochrome c oxidase-assembly factor COX23 [Microsporum canis CBS 113480]EEQ34378.1 cytochrome c oxidase-assembly factor COX23 [Microsporum canis CBS 113480]
MSSADKQTDSQNIFNKAEPRFRKYVLLNYMSPSRCLYNHLSSSKSASEYMDPCQEFADRSIKCMRRNNGDRDMCTDYFQAYRDCKKAWLNQKKSKGSAS